MNVMHGKHYENGFLVPNRMNPIRRRLLNVMIENMRRHVSSLGTGTSNVYLENAMDASREFMERSRGKGRG